MSQEAPSSIVIFGASGDLTNRKLIPALFNLVRKRRLRAPLRIVGHSQTSYAEQAFRQHLRDGLGDHASFTFTEIEWQDFSANIDYHQEIGRAHV